jgi:hypothetical protein
VSFDQKILTVQFSLAQGNFQGGGNSLTLTNMRIQAQIHGTPGTSSSFLDGLDIYGMTLSQMNQLSRIGKQLGTANPNNKVMITAQDGDNPSSIVFNGVILQAYIIGQDQPHVHFHVTATPAAAAARKAMPSTTKQGATQAQMLAQNISSAMGFQFENNNFSATLRNPYLWGTGISQMRQLSKAAGFDWGIDPGTNVLAIWPKGMGRTTGGVPTISPYISGPGELIGYPVFSDSRVYATAYFDPQMQPFGQFNLVSSITAANGIWWVSQLELNLSSFTPHGPWEMTVIGDPTGQTPSPGNQ